MINANELRVGNYLEPLFIDKPFCIVKGIDEEYVYSDCISTDYTGFDEFKPIILTEEWLLKMGFECANGNDITLTVINNLEESHSDLHFWGAIDNDYESGLSGDCVELYNEEHNTAFGVPIKFVHQLQNLYFALTQKELFYNPSEEVGNYQVIGTAEMVQNQPTGYHQNVNKPTGYHENLNK